MRKALIASAVSAMLAAMPMASSAAVMQLITPGSIAPPAAANLPVDLTAPSSETAAIAFMPGGSDFTQTYTFTAINKLKVIDLNLTAIGNSADVSTTEWVISGVSPAVDGSGPFVFGGGPVTTPDFILDAGDQFVIEFDGNGVASISTASYNFSTVAVPVPAALPLLAGGIGLLGLVSRRRKSS